LRGMVEQPKQRVSELPLLTEAERLSFLAAPATAPSGCIHEAFEAQAARRPDAVAVVCGDERLTYRELDERANQLAHHLRGLGVGRESLVALCLPRSLEMLVAILGVLKAGGAYLPMEPGVPEGRRAFMLEDAEAKVLIADPRNVPPDYAGQVVQLEDLAAGRRDRPAPLATRESCAYVIYTSGSTGNPKGVRVSHANVTRLFTATDELFGFGERDVWTLFHSYAFDFSVWEIWGALIYGGRLVVVPHEVSRSPEAFHELLVRERVTVLNQTPSAFRLLVAADADSPGRLGLEWVIFGGEAVDLGSLRPWFARHGDEQPRLVNMYGITETTVHVTHRRLRAADLEGSPSPIGRPIRDLTAYLLDGRQELVPIGVPGEIYVGGAGVALGYLNRPELTAQRFVDDPFVPGERLYRSGDRGRWLSDGTLEYLGRLDHQVKIRGFRIELGEIENELRNHPAVREAVVIARADERGEKRLVAYVVGSAASLRAHLQSRLPEYMIPAAFIELAAIPLTVNGKVDREALPSPAGTRPELEREYRAPRTLDEELLAGIWAEVLELEQVGIDDGFFELGGDSIVSLQVVSKAQSAGLHLSVRSLFQHQTIRELASALTGAQPEPQAIEAFGLIAPADRARLPDDVEDAYPLARLQAGMIFHSQSSPGTSVYHDIASLHLKGEGDPASLRAALDQLAAAHPILRTSFDFTRYSEPLQLVHRAASIPLIVKDVSALTAEEQEQRLRSCTEAERAQGFALDQAPLLRVYLHLRGGTWQLTLACHHAILDGWSLASLLAELMRDGLPREAPVSRYRELIALERSALASTDAQAFWERYLDGATLASLPAGESAGPARRLVKVPIEPATLRGLKKLAARAGAPLKSVLLAAHLRVMSALSGEADVVTGVVANGRPERQDAERALGLYLNTLPFRQRLSRTPWEGLVRETFDNERGLMQHRRYPLAEMQRRHGATLFETAFNFIHFHVYEDAAAKVLDHQMFEATNLKLVASFMIDVRDPGAVRLQLAIAAPELSDAQVEQICGYYERALLQMARAPDAPPESLLSAAERQQLLREWNPPVTATTAGWVHERFAAEARRRPDATAVICGDERLTYRQLNQRANQLAHHLKARGVASDAPVALLLSRSLEMVVAILGVLKAGGTYVPMEPGNPAGRIGFMLADTGAAILLTQAAHAHKAEGFAGLVLRLDTDWSSIASQPDADPAVPIDSESCAYVIYTSGSTGNPKGVRVSHGNVARLFTATEASFRFGERDVWTLFHSYAFDFSVWEIWGALIYGGSLVVVPYEVSRSPQAFYELAAREEVTVLNQTPSAFRLFAAVDEEQRLCEGLRYVIFGGEAVDLASLRPWFARRGDQQPSVVNMYGITETTVHVTYRPLRIADLDGSPSPIGRPLADLKAYVLDADRQLLPAGVAGELYVGGAGVALGYLNRPELTAERFVANPFCPGERLYRTGDRARWQLGGTLEYLGRLDHQVKIRGFRI
ncbi:MAG TPA: amino acid adenylation domain-containing protein, partial [Myxococcales bacterium]|nr:amino acid adenylation domain-containing protein [Myxococcales bacterium]